MPANWLSPQRRMSMAIMVVLLVFLAGIGGVGAQGPRPTGGTGAASISAGCPSGSGYDSGCDVDHDGAITVVDLQRVAARYTATGAFTSDGWLLTGNSGTIPTTNFLGTSDAQPLIIQPGSGKMGIGTTGNLGGKLSIYSNISTANIPPLYLISTSGETGVLNREAEIRLQNNSNTNGAFAGIQNNDASGDVTASIDFINVDQVYAGAIRFITRSGESVYGERLRIDQNGNVGIGLTNPVYQLQLSTDSAAKPTSNAWTVVSDRRLKNDIRPFTDGLSTLERIDPVRYTLNGKGGMPQGTQGIGVIAQDVKNAIPYTISTFKAKLEPGDKEATELYSFDSSALTFVTINAVKELKAQNDAQQSRITALEQQNQTLQAEKEAQQQQMQSMEARLAALEKAAGQSAAPSAAAGNGGLAGNLPGAGVVLGGLLLAGLLLGPRFRSGG
ncbi:MAG: tail fiber domain-containing protein [Chloroflexi bacterium]|nr:tail fiber domain-containing protein [Chloroflexota bacterium]